MTEPSDAGPRPEATAAATDAKPLGLEEALSWQGAKVDEIAGATVGRVEGVYVDADDGEPRWLLVRMGRFGHHSLLPLAHAAAAAGRVWAPYEREGIREAPRLEPGEELTRERERELLYHYGIPESAAIAAGVVARPEGSITARPSGQG